MQGQGTVVGQTAPMKASLLDAGPPSVTPAEAGIQSPTNVTQPAAYKTP